MKQYDIEVDCSQQYRFWENEKTCRLSICYTNHNRSRPAAINYEDDGKFQYIISPVKTWENEKRL